jgi:hypothetical protein
MSNEDKMLQLVLSDNNLSSSYEYNAEDFPTVEDALRADNPVVVAVAKIIRGAQRDFWGETSVNKSLYKEIFNYLNQNLL